ncbi:MAG: YihA family ribosome biogenesis GTP-binding protein [Lachnospiraceae bacterium]|nr:YihA family ribosome biogenesis GTP-binding protein [Lachnospiraceae bacterium]
MKIKNVNLETVCGITSKLPNNTLAEFAFAGKSNVGKSSLINAFMNRKTYARISSSPGKTQTINYYNINGEFYLVDLPGYGYAKVAESVKVQWGKMIERYLKKSPTLKCVFLLVDIRHEPSANDVQMYDWIVANGFEPVVIATKADKVSKNAVNKQVAVINKTLRCVKGTTIIPFSALDKRGLEDIYKIVEDSLSDKNPEI